MHNVHRVTVVESMEDLGEDKTGLLFAEEFFVNDAVEEFTTSA